MGAGGENGPVMKSRRPPCVKLSPFSASP
jgi:hypothetical protein